MSFLIVITNRYIEFFPFFAWNYSIIKAKNWAKIILIKLLFWGFGDKSSPEWVQNKFFSVLSWMEAWDVSNFFWMKLHQHKRLKCFKQLFFVVIIAAFLLEKNLVLNFAETIFISCKLKLSFFVLNSLSYLFQ